MIGMSYFEENEPGAEEVLQAVARLGSARAGADCALRLVPELDAQLRSRILELNVEAFGREGETFDRRGLDEVAADPDAMLLVLEIAGSVEGFFFGYYEEPSAPIVPGADYFMDTGMIRAPWRHRGLGLLSMAAMLLLIGCLEDVKRPGMAVWSGDVERLTAIYARFGFNETPCHAAPHTCMIGDMSPEWLDHWRAMLGLPPLSDAAPDGSSSA